MRSMRSIFLAFALTGVLALVMAMSVTLTTRPPVVEAAAGKNLKIYPKGTDVAQIKKDMKQVAKALGVKCEYCHDLEQMDKDSELKKKARLMMKMVGVVNASLKSYGFIGQVSCVTCDNGQKKPPKK